VAFSVVFGRWSVRLARVRAEQPLTVFARGVVG